MDCKFDRIKGCYYIEAGLLWLIFSVWWIINTFVVNKRYVNPLHKALTFIVFFKMINYIILTGMYIFCDEKSSLFIYFYTCYKYTYTLGNTFMYTSLVLISKGFCITKELLTGGEVVVISLVISGSYLGFSAQVENNLELTNVIIAMMLVYLSLIVNFTLKNIKILQNESENNGRTPEQLEAKISIFKQYLRVAQCIFTVRILFLLILNFDFRVINNLSASESYGIASADDICEFIGFFFICYLFRTRDSEQWFIESLSDANYGGLPPFLQANLSCKTNQTLKNSSMCVYVCPQSLHSDVKSYKLLIARQMKINHNNKR